MNLMPFVLSGGTVNTKRTMMNLMDNPMKHRSGMTLTQTVNMTQYLPWHEPRPGVPLLVSVNANDPFIGYFRAGRFYDVDGRMVYGHITWQYANNDAEDDGN
jgi:hypothetical protein